MKLYVLQLWSENSLVDVSFHQFLHLYSVTLFLFYLPATRCRKMRTKPSSFLSKHPDNLIHSRLVSQFQRVCLEWSPVSAAVIWWRCLLIKVSSEKVSLSAQATITVPALSRTLGLSRFRWHDWPVATVFLKMWHLHFLLWLFSHLFDLLGHIPASFGLQSLQEYGSWNMGIWEFYELRHAQTCQLLI